jgi:hypothetical protein
VAFLCGRSLDKLIGRSIKSTLHDISGSGHASFLSQPINLGNLAFHRSDIDPYPPARQFGRDKNCNPLP